MSHIIHNAPGLVSFGERGRQWVYDNFNIDSVAARTEAVYRAIVQRNSQSTVQVDDAPFSPSILPLTPQAFTPNANSPLSTKEKSVRPPLTTSKNSRDQTRRPLISVTIPAYNPGDFLDECLNGLFQQSYGPLEIIVVDDASTDHTPTIVREWIKKAKKTDNRTVVYHRLPINVGFAHALSIGYFLATGDFIANHDADDISHHQRIEKQVGFLLKHEDCNMVGTNYEVFSDRVDTRTKSYLVKYGDAVDAAYRQGKHCVCFGSLLFQRRVLERIGGLTSFAQGAEDFEFVARAITQGFKVDNIRQALYYYRAHENQRSREFYSSLEALGDPVSHP